MRDSRIKCGICFIGKLRLIKTITKKPNVEVDYKIPANDYLRHIYKCSECKIYFNKHSLLEKNFYSGNYNKSIDNGILKDRFEKIIRLDRKNSDNKIRVSRIDKFYKQYSSNNKTVLDIGSGTCVFLYEMKKIGYKTFCFDPDIAAVNHASDIVKVDGAYHGDIFEKINLGNIGLITFNKVLEHLINPISHLKKSREYLSDNGILYVELPEGDRIVKTDMIEKRAEFAVEHYYVFNSTSINYLLSQAGFKLLESDIITEPSGKHTIYAFAKRL